MPPGSAPVIVVTGATSGVGAASAALFARQGARVVVVARDRDRAEAIRATLPGAPPPVIADLATLAGMRSAAEALRSAYPSVDVLVNNAGGVFMRREETVDGRERTFALNVLAPYVLTTLLVPSLRTAPHPRVVNVASAAHHGAHLHFDDLESHARYRGFSVYSRSKLALILETRAFARRWRADDLAFFAVHPGFVRSRFGLANGRAFAFGMRITMGLGGISPARAARTVAYAALSPDLAGRTGDYIARARIAHASREADAAADGDRLMSVLAGWSGLPSDGPLA
jgi:NAD(P)-dependent dehydrogenase (short-subunit alcohol dehydrogenase family)